jgi:DNA-binding winged helix-turn-helix (wHTH) protein
MPLEPPSVPLWLDLANERLWCGDQARALRPKTFALLRYLMAHPGQVLPKAVLLEALWPETVVSEVVLAVCVRELRQVLGDNARAPRFIETVHRRGYRFLGQLHQLRREVHAAHEWFEAALALASEQGLARWLPISMHERGWALAAQGQHDEGMAQMRQGIAALQATGTKMNLPYLLARLAEASGNSGQAEEGLRPLAEALAVMDDTGGRRDEAWLYHIKGELLLQQASAWAAASRPNRGSCELP